MTPLGDEGQTDEIELDFDSLDAPTLWRLEAYLRSLNAGNGNFHVEVRRLFSLGLMGVSAV